MSAPTLTAAEVVEQLKAVLPEIEFGRETHILWASARAEDYAANPQIGDREFHLKTVTDYDARLKAIRDALAYLSDTYLTEPPTAEDQELALCPRCFLASPAPTGGEAVAWFPLLGTPFAMRRDALNERHAQKIHAQSLTRLAERGGLSPDEALLNINRGDFRYEQNKNALRDLIAILSPQPSQSVEVSEGDALRNDVRNGTSQKWIRAWRNRFITERIGYYQREEAMDYETATAHAEADANTFADSFTAALAAKGNGR